MQYSQKKPYKNFYNKSKTYDPEYYENGSSEGPSSQNNYYKQNNPYKYSKTKKYYNESRNYQSSLQTDRPMIQGEGAFTNTQGNTSQYNYNQWQHDKDPTQTQKNINTERNRSGRNDYKYKNKNNKRPDRQLYSARDKHVQGEDSKPEMLVTNPGESDSNKEIKNSRIIDKQSTGSPNFEENPIEEGNKEKKHVQTMQAKPLKAGEEKEIHPSEEDKSFVSNVSTAMSERLKNSEEENSSREKANSFDMTHNLKTAEQKVLFQIILYNEKGSEKVKFYEDEEDYEQMLEKVCRNNNITGKMNLYFKINMLNMLKKACNSSHNKARIDTVLEKYEDENAKLIFYELGIAGAHESIKKYLETQSFQPYEGLYNYPIQKYK